MSKRQMNVECYSRDGYRIILPLMVESPADVGRELEFVRMAGLLPERLEKPDEYESGRVSHVARRDKADGTAHIAFYHENPGMERRYVTHYMDSEQDRREFEAATGMLLADLPAYEGDTHPVMDGSARAHKYIVALREPILIKRRTKYVTDAEGNWEPRHKLEAYLTKVAPLNVLPPPISKPDTPPAMQDSPDADKEESSPAKDDSIEAGQFDAPDKWDSAAYTRFWKLVKAFELNDEDVLEAVTGYKAGKLKDVQVAWGFDVLKSMCLKLPMPEKDIPFLRSYNLFLGVGA